MISLSFFAYGWVFRFFPCHRFVHACLIDQFGDHLLGCSHGPLRIQCHDALVTVVHHALLRDHPGVLREQGIASSDQSRPGDILSP